jgi:hypothetical protein
MPNGQQETAVAAIDAMSRGAITLLAIAQENDKYKKIADNEALRRSLEVLHQLSDFCAQHKDDALLALTDERELPRGWFSFCVSLVNKIDSNLEKVLPGKTAEWSSRTDFDRNVYLAIGQTIGEIIREQHGKRDSLDFTTEQLIESLAKAQPARLQQLLMENYIGNILQELFDTCKIRLGVRDLPKDTELNLRRNDAHLLAGTLFAQHMKNRTSVDIPSLLQSLKELLALVWQKDATQ